MAGKTTAKVPKNGRPKDQTKADSERVDFLVWTDIVKEVPPDISADKLGISARALRERRAKLKAFVDPTGELLKTGFQSAMSLLAVEAFNTLMYHVKEQHDKDLSIRILENIEALKRVNETPTAGAGFSLQQFFTDRVSDNDSNRIRGSLRTAVNSSGFGG